MASISVVIPALNDASMLKVCLAALAAQSRPADEIIVVDNGSTDDTAEVAAAGGARVIPEPIRGIYPATSTGYDAATGDVIARLDADSIPDPGWLERIDFILGELPPLTAVTGAASFYGSNPVTHFLGRKLYIGGMYWSMNILLGHPMVFGSNFAMPTEIWLRVRETANRSITTIHDDLDLSWHFEPDMGVYYDRALKVKISARPFHSVGSVAKRVAWVWTTLSLDFREQSPFARRRARRNWEEEHLLDPTTDELGDEPDGLIA